ERISEAVFGTSQCQSLMLLASLALLALVAFNTLFELFGGLRLFRLAGGMQFIQSAIFAGLGVTLVLFWEASARSLVIAFGGAGGRGQLSRRPRAAAAAVGDRCLAAQRSPAPFESRLGSRPAAGRAQPDQLRAQAVGAGADDRLHFPGARGADPVRSGFPGQVFRRACGLVAHGALPGVGRDVGRGDELSVVCRTPRPEQPTLGRRLGRQHYPQCAAGAAVW